MSDAIYGRDDKPEFSLKIQNWGELERLGLDSNTISYLSTANMYDGLKAALYREYITGKYVLAFAGTENPAINKNVWNALSWSEWADWLNNFYQAFGDGADQYTYAIAIGAAFTNNPNLNSSNTYITGHSLGGGLASAAAIASGFHAYTFNAAGLHPNTVKDYPVNYANAASLVTVYQVDWDILSWGQYVASWPMWLFGVNHVPEAVGTKVPIDSEYDWEMFVGVTLGPLLCPLTGPIVGGGVTLGTMLYSGIMCHLMDQVIYGMEKRIF